MKKYRILLTSLLVISITNRLFAQDIAVVEKGINPAGVIDELPLPPPKLEGSFYLFDSWKNGDIILRTNDTIYNVTLNYDLQNYMLEIKTSSQIKGCPPNFLKGFQVEKLFGAGGNFQNITLYDKSRLGLIDIKYKKGDYAYGIEPYIFIKEPNYVPTMGTGSQHREVIQKTRDYLIDHNKLIPIKRTKKSVINISDQHSVNLGKFIKENKLNLKKDNDLAALMKYYIDSLN